MSRTASRTAIAFNVRAAVGALFATLAICLIAVLASAGPALAAKSCSGKPVTSSNPVIVIRVSYATGPYSDSSLGGTYCAAPVKQKNGYELYDVVLWPDRISCYRFKQDFQKTWEEFFDTYHYTTEAKSDKDALKLREKYSIYSKKMKIGENENSDNSKKKYEAFKAIFKKVAKLTPSTHVVLKYSGHGGGVDLFCAINESYTLKTLQAGVKAFGAKFAIIDYGTNCMSASSYTLRKYAPYTDYMIMSQQDWGGWGWDAKTENKDGTIKEKYLGKDSDSRYHIAFGAGTSIAKSAKKLVDLNRDEWTVLSSASIKKDKVECSNTAVKTSAFMTLYKKMSYSQRNHWSGDVYTAVKGSGSLKKLYNKAVVNYKSSRSLGVKWKSRDHGISVW